MSNNNSNNNTNKHLDKRGKMNRNISVCLKDCKLFENSEVKIKDLDSLAYKNEDSYQKSFENITEFSQSIPENDKKEISVCIYNASNNDGLFSAWAYYKFLDVNNLCSDKIAFIPLSAASGNKVDYHLQRQLDIMENKTVIIVDIAYSMSNLELIASVANKIYVIDDHPRKNENRKVHNKIEKLKGNWFIGDDRHSASAYTWKFFFPTENVPIIIQYTDNGDRKLNLPFLFYDRAFETYINFRITHSPYIQKFTNCDAFQKLDEQINNIDKNFMLMVGHYYDELVNNIKEQVARNAKLQYFQGHPVYVLNYNDPVLYKMVARQMVTNAEKKGDRIDFAVLWGYEYTSNAYKVFMSEKHGGPPKYNLPELARTLAKRGGHHLGGGGSKYVGNFYWPHDKTHDIWDLFEKPKKN